MAYFTLFTHEGEGWGCAFGDHDKECVEFEVQSMKDEAAREGWKLRTKIVKTARVPTRNQVQAMVAELNAKDG